VTSDMCLENLVISRGKFRVAKRQELNDLRRNAEEGKAWCQEKKGMDASYKSENIVRKGFVNNTFDGWRLKAMVRTRENQKSYVRG